MEILLQLWGGLFYLFAKIFLARAEGEENSKWRTWGWITYLLGVPPWVIILALNQNWIAMALEAGCFTEIIMPRIIAGIPPASRAIAIQFWFNANIITHGGTPRRYVIHPHVRHLEFSSPSARARKIFAKR